MFGFDAQCTDLPGVACIQVSSATTVGTVSDAITTVIAVGLVGYLIWILTARWRAASLARAARAGAAAVVGHRADGAGGRRDRRADRRRRPERGLRRPEPARPARLRLGAVHVPGRPAAQPRRARGRRRGAARSASARPGTDDLRGRLAEALDDPGLQLLYWVDDCWVRKDGRPGELRDAAGPWSSSTASGSARSCTTAACARSRRC